MPALKSSNLASADYDEATRTLTVEFVSGATYSYSGVPQETYDGLMSSPSAGSFFYRFIRDRFPTERIS